MQAAVSLGLLERLRTTPRGNVAVMHAPRGLIAMERAVVVLLTVLLNHLKLDSPISLGVLGQLTLEPLRLLGEPPPCRPAHATSMSMSMSMSMSPCPCPCPCSMSMSMSPCHAGMRAYTWATWQPLRCAGAWLRAPDAPSGALLPDWRESTDPSSGAVCYSNPATNETRSERPVDLALELPSVERPWVLPPSKAFSKERRARRTVHIPRGTTCILACVYTC